MVSGPGTQVGLDVKLSSEPHICTLCSFILVLLVVIEPTYCLWLVPYSLGVLFWLRNSALFDLRLGWVVALAPCPALACLLPWFAVRWYGQTLLAALPALPPCVDLHHARLNAPRAVGAPALDRSIVAAMPSLPWLPSYRLFVVVLYVIALSPLSLLRTFLFLTLSCAHFTHGLCLLVTL
jgi:hypothetical protein